MAGASGLFLREGGSIVPLTETAYDAEAVLQELLAQHSELLPGEAIDPDDPKRFLLVDREVSVAGLSLDHLFLDQDAVPTLVETKRGTNREGRREVVAQMLDYAANAAVEWDAGTIEQLFCARCEKDGLDPDAALSDFQHNSLSDEAFFKQVEEHLRAGKVRLIFVADEIPTSLQRIVEFMNERMTPTEVLAIEIRQYLSGDKQLLQASLVGQTTKAREVKTGRKLQVSALPALIEKKVLNDGDHLWVLRDKVHRSVRPDSADDERLRFTLLIENGDINLCYEADGVPEMMKASQALARARKQLGQTKNLGTAAVAENMSKDPGGPSLAEIARETGVWS